MALASRRSGASCQRRLLGRRPSPVHEVSPAGAVGRGGVQRVDLPFLVCPSRLGLVPGHGLVEDGFYHAKGLPRGCQEYLLPSLNWSGMMTPVSPNGTGAYVLCAMCASNARSKMIIVQTETLQKL